MPHNFHLFYIPNTQNKQSDNDFGILLHFLSISPVIGFSKGGIDVAPGPSLFSFPLPLSTFL